MSELKLKTARGYSLLEYSAVLPILLLFILGAFDINNLLQGYNAIQSGVKTTLRCAYPTDGECVNAHADPRERLFNVSRIEGNSTYYVEAKDYRGEASWLGLPNYEFSSGRGSFVGSVSYQVPQLQAEAVRRAAEGTVSFSIRTATVPYVSGNPLNPNFTITPNGNQYAAELSQRLSVRGSSRFIIDRSRGQTDYSAPEIGASQEFMIPRPERPCFTSSNIDSDSANANHNANFLSPCNPDFTNIMIHITGATEVNENHLRGAEGKVMIELHVEGVRRPVELGGRKIENGGPNDDFVPRGFLKDAAGNPTRISDSIANSQYNGEDGEVNVHTNILVPYDKKFKIVFKLFSLDGERVNWHGEDLRIFLPKYENRDPIVTCLTYPTEGVIAGSKCATAHPAGEAYNLVDLSNTFALPCGTTKADFKNYLKNNLGVSDFNKYEYTLKTGVTCGLSQPKGHDCPAEAGVFNLSQAAALCPVNDTYLKENNLAPVNTVWNLKNKQFNFTPFTYTAPDCQHLWPSTGDLPVGLRGYQDLVFDAPQLKGHTPLYTRNSYPQQSPEQIKDSSTQYSCQEIGLVKRIYDDNSPQEQLSNRSLFRGVHDDLGCAWKEILRENAMDEEHPKYKLDPAAWFDVSYSGRGERPQTDKPENCVPYRQAVNQITSQEDLGIFQEAAIPAFCKDGSSQCRITFAGFTNEGEGAKTTLDLERAVETWGRPVIEAAFPRANFVNNTENCTEPYCASITLNQSGANNEFVRASGRINIPVFMLRPFGRTSVELTYNDQERLEKDFAK